MISNCPRSLVPRFIPQKAFGVFFLFLAIFLFPAFARSQAGLFDACGEGGGTCGTGLSCVKGECLGGNGYITDDPSGCSPELSWQNGRCVIDVTSHGERLGLGETTTDLRDSIRTFLNILLGFLGVISVIVIMYAGFVWMTSFGNADRVTKAKKTILWGVIGILVIGSSWTIASYVLGLGKKGTGVIDVPAGDDGGDMIPQPGGVAEQFALDDVETGRPYPIEKQSEDTDETNLPNENVYLCSAIQARFNHQVNAESFEASKSALIIKQKPKDGTDDDIDEWTTVDSSSMPSSAWNQNGQYISFEHLGEGNNLFQANTKYAAVYPRTLTDTGNPAFPLANCAAIGCEVQEDRVVWRFASGSESDPDAPELNPQGTYPKAYASSDPSYPSRGVSTRPTIVIAFNEPILASSAVETYNVTDEGGNVLEERIIPRKDVFELGAFTLTDGEIVTKNTLITGSNLRAVPNNEFIARFEDYGYGSRLVLQIAPAAANLASNIWYQIKIAGVKDLCGNVFDGERHFHFQISGSAPRLDPTPPNNLTKVCYQNIAVGVVSNVSLYDVVKDSCSVGVGDGPNGFVTEGALTPVAGRSLMVMDDLPSDPEERKLITNYDQYCRRYFFEPKTSALTPGEKYQAEVKTRFPLDDKGTLLNSAWSFTTAGLNEQCVYPPILESVSPTGGGKGQCIGISGEHIDYFSTDEVRTDTSGSKEVIELQKVNDDQSAVTCANISSYIDKNAASRWSDRSVLTKMQEGDTASLPPECPSPIGQNGKTFRIIEHIIDEKNGLNFSSTSVDFTLTNGAIGPCLEEIRPNANVFRADTITLLGSDFGDYGLASKVVYFDNASDTVLGENAWGDTKITSTIPLPANTGDVYIVNKDGARSNGKTLTIPELKEVTVTIRDTCEANLNKSPNPFFDEPNVCLIGKDTKPITELESARLPVFIEFETSDQSAMRFLNTSGAFFDPKNYELSDGTLSRNPDSVQQSSIVDAGHVGISLLFQNKTDDLFLKFGTPYTLTIHDIIDDKNISPPSKFSVSGSPFKFTTILQEKAEQNGCYTVESVALGLKPETIQYSAYSDASASARNASCQELSGLSFAWSANSLETKDGAQLKDEAGNEIQPSEVIETPLAGSGDRVRIQSKNSAIVSEAAAPIIATADDAKQTSGTNRLIVRNSAYCEKDDDCKKNCAVNPGDTVQCVSNQCNPYVKSVAPSSAGASEWVTAQGCYFGDDPGTNGKVSFIQGETTKLGGFSFPPQCPKDKLWSDTQIITIVPKGLENTGAGDNPSPPRAFVEVTSATKRESNQFNGLTVTDAKVHPMLCAIEPEEGGVNEAVIVYGEGLNLEGTREAVFKNTATSVILKSVATPIDDNEANTSVPEDAQNGRHEVRYRVGSLPESNPLQFKVNDEGRASVVSVFPEANTKKCGANGVVCDAPGDLVGMGFVEFDKEIFCDSEVVTDCIVVLENGNPIPGVGYAVEIGERGFLFNTPEGTARLQVQGSYTARLYQSKIKTKSNKKTVSCGAIPVVDEDSGICEWSFTITNQIIPKEIIVAPKADEDGVIILTPNHPSRDEDAADVFTAIVKNEQGADVSDLVPINWHVDKTGVALNPDGVPSRDVQLRAVEDPESGLYSLGKFTLTATVRDYSGNKDVTGNYTVEVQNDKALQISDYFPSSASACRNGVVGVVFNKPVNPNSVAAGSSDEIDAVQLWGDSSSSCFTEPPSSISRFWLKRLASRVLSWLKITKARGQEQELSFNPCGDETEIVFDDPRSPTRVNIVPKDRTMILSVLKTYEVRVYGSSTLPSQKYVTAADGNRLFATSVEGCGATGLVAGKDANGSYCSFTFTSKDNTDEHSGICTVDTVAIEHSQMTEPTLPADLFIYKQGVKEILTAQAYSLGAPVYPTSGYMWDFVNWRKDAESDILVLGDNDDITKPVEKSAEEPLMNEAGIAAQPFDGAGAKIPLNPDGSPSSNLGTIRAGEVTVRVDLSFAKDNQIKTDLKESALWPLVVRVRPCEGGGDLFWKYSDPSQASNFSFSYCQKPQAGSNTLPRLRSEPVSVSQASSRDVLNEYFLLYEPESKDGNFDSASSDDRLLIRVFPAANYFVSTDARLPIEHWYTDNEEKIFEETSPAGSHAPVDGYDALETDSAVYVHALNVSFKDSSPDKIYSNVYVLAATDGASEKTKDIMEQLVSNWEFNTNIKDKSGTSRDSVKIAALKNDYKRILGLSRLGSELALYRTLLGSFPALADSRIPGVAVSAWDKEWREDFSDARVHLGAALEQGLKTAITLPFDPLDKRWTSEKESGRMLNDCLQKTPDDLFDCLWGTVSNAPMACLVKTDNLDLKTLGLGFDKDSDGADKPDAVELFTCYDNEAYTSTGEYYCRGNDSRAYQYVRDESGSFTLYGNLEYTDFASAWCGGSDAYSCTGWSGGETSFCEWHDPEVTVPEDEFCRPRSVAQPACASELPINSLPRDETIKTEPFNIMFRPL